MSHRPCRTDRLNSLCLHAGDVCVLVDRDSCQIHETCDREVAYRDILLIEIFAEIRQRRVCQEARVQLGQEASLFRRLVPRVPASLLSKLRIVQSNDRTHQI